MVRQHHMEGHFLPAVHMCFFLTDTLSRKRRVPCSLAQEQAVQLRGEAGVIVTIPLHKDALPIRRAVQVNVVGNEKYSHIN